MEAYSEPIVRAALEQLMLVEIAAIATEMASAEEVRSLAEHILAAYSENSVRLVSLLENKQIPLPATLGVAHAVRMHRLVTIDGEQFDREFLGASLEKQEGIVFSLVREASSGPDPDVRNYAADVLPGLESLLRLARDTDLARIH